jgi:beta-phosphoglucomutase-like phosphatase (HAD superfamily)
MGAVILDCDGVLVDSEVLALEVEHATLRKFGVAIDPAEYAQLCLGLNEADWFAALGRAAPSLRERLSEFRAHLRFLPSSLELGRGCGPEATISRACAWSAC